MHRGVGVGFSDSSCARTLFCILEGVILSCNGNGNDFVKGIVSARSPSLLGGDVYSTVSVVAFSRAPCFMLDEDFSRMCLSSASMCASTIMFAASSKIRLSILVLVAASVIEVQVSSILEVSVTAVAVEARDFLVIS